MDQMDFREPSNHRERKRFGMRRLLGILFLLVLIILVVMMIYLLGNNTSTTVIK